MYPLGSKLAGIELIVIQQDIKKSIDAVICEEEYNMEFRTELGPRKAVIGSKSEGQSSGHTNGACLDT
jgi:hypothetical protein